MRIYLVVSAKNIVTCIKNNTVHGFFQNCNLTSYYSQQNFFSDVSGLHDAQSKLAVSTMTTSMPFIYLLQTEQCLPQNLALSTRIGDSKTCNCDVIVLSFKAECQHKNSSHISYYLPRKPAGPKDEICFTLLQKRECPTTIITSSWMMIWILNSTHIVLKK